MNAEELAAIEKRAMRPDKDPGRDVLVMQLEQARQDVKALSNIVRRAQQHVAGDPEVMPESRARALQYILGVEWVPL